MAVKFSQFTNATDAATIDKVVGYKVAGDLNVQIPPLNLDTTYAMTTADGVSPVLTLTGTKPGSTAANSGIAFSGTGAITVTGTAATNDIVISAPGAVVESGTPTIGNIPLFTSANAIGDSIVSQSTQSAITLNVGSGFIPATPSSGSVSLPISLSSNPFGTGANDLSQFYVDFGSQAQADIFRNATGWPAFTPPYNTNSTDITFTFTFSGGGTLTFTQPAGQNAANGASTIRIGYCPNCSGGGLNGTQLVYVSGSGSISSGDTVDLITASTSVSIGGQLSMATNKITNVVDPTGAQDAATKSYVDASGDTYTLNAGTKAGSSVPLNLDAAAGTDSTVSLTEGTGITLTRTSATEITIDNDGATTFNGLGGGLAFYAAAGGQATKQITSDANLVVDSNLNIGIGTPSPQYSVDIHENASDPTLNLRANSSTNELQFSASQTLGNPSIINSTTTDLNIQGGGSNILTLGVNNDPGSAILGQYGQGTKTGTAAYNLAVNNVGKIIEVAAGGSLQTQTVSVGGSVGVILDTLYVLTSPSSVFLDLPSNPSDGDSFSIANQGVASGVNVSNVIQQAASNEPIMGSSSNLTINNANASFDLVYSSGTNGWTIVGAS